MNRKVCFLLALIILLSCFPNGAWAAEPLFNHGKVLNEGQRVENIFLYGKNGIISGEVDDEVVVINGNLTLTSTAVIKDRVFVVGGQLTKAPEARVGKGIYCINFGDESLNSLLLGMGVFALIELAKLFLSLLILFASLISLLVLKKRAAKAKTMLQDNTLKTGLLGLFAAIGLGLVLAALAVTVWGIPAAILVGIILIILLPIGLGALSTIIGGLLLRSFAWGQKPFNQVLIGSLFMVALLNFPVLGVLWGVLVLIFALGALAASLLPEKANFNA